MIDEMLDDYDGMSAMDMPDVSSDEGMTDEELLAFLQSEQNAASEYAWGELAEVADTALADYDRLGYEGDEDREGQSTFVDSSVHDAVETILPDLLNVFHAGEKVFEFEARREAEEDGAKQATHAVNYVYENQNNGFWISHTVIKDALQTRIGAAHAFKELVDRQEIVRLEPMPFEQLTYAVQQIEAELADKNGSVTVVEQSTETVEQAGIIDGIEVVESVELVRVKLRKDWQEKAIRIEPLPISRVLVRKDWHTPILERCPYVCTLERVTLSDLRQMGFDVTADDLTDTLDGRINYNTANNPMQSGEFYETHTPNDESLKRGWLRREYVLVDRDGDGIAERRRILRLDHKILEDEEYSHVPVFIVSPYLRSHRWDGYSVWDHLHDIQRHKSATVRDIDDSLSLSTKPRKLVLTDANWTPLVNLEDLTDHRIGTAIRTKDMNALREEKTLWVGQDALPYLEMQEGMKENRIGISRHNPGLGADSLNKTATGATIQENKQEKREKLVARIIAEMFFVPMGKSILRLLTEGDMPNIAAKIGGEYVEFNPSDYLHEYDVKLNVGLGTGDKQANLMALDRMFMAQQVAMGMPTPDGVPLVTPKEIAHTLEKMAENSGFRQPDRFVMHPESDDAAEIRQQLEANKQPPPPPIELELARIKGEQEMQRKQMEEQFAAAAEEAKNRAAIERQRMQDQTNITIQEMKDRVAVALAEMQAQVEIAKIQSKGDEDRATEAVKVHRHKASIEHDHDDD